MLDVLLVLLIIFMAMSIQVHRTVDAQLPQACAGVCDGPDLIVLEVLPGPSYRVNKTAVSTHDLFEYLTTVYRPRPKKELQVAGYPGVRYKDVIAAMDVAKSAGVTVIGIAPKASYLHR